MQLRLVAWLGALVIAGLVVAAGLFMWANRYGEIAPITPPDPTGFSADLLERGERLAALGGCETCHTRPGGERLAGGFELPTPFGTVVSTNITPDPENGIGRWSEVAFTRAMRQGVDREGEHLYPAFPYDSFTKMTDGDLGALYAYLMSQPAVAYAPPETALPFPFGMRPILEGWKVLFLKEGAYVADASKDADWNRGAYLIESVGHCGACHSPRNPFGAVDASRPLGGAEAEGWHVPALGPASLAAIPWDQDAYVNYLFDGWDENHGIAAGPMVPVIDHNFGQEEDDVFAMATYLAALTTPPAAADIEAAVAAADKLDWQADERPGGPNAPTDQAMLRGEKLFFEQCADCHKARVAKAQPVSLALTPTVRAPDARNVAHIIINGLTPPRGSVQRSMPGQSRSVSDADIADLLAYMRWRFTDLPAWTNIPDAVAEARRGAH